ncbi:TolA protein [Bartonella australis AUST/NH1]|uniref:TolA protein n=1 Tax=Bartonella australis (strain Aust/NH1) TaxID=1094489 RepID=M1N577_BARAA|nr:hypothetical protein [Bartonella australis]AGF75019.1 TolA protein [Bartonella australis AUST/NH1]
MNKDLHHNTKWSLILSLAAHVILLSWGSVHFINSVPLPQQQLEAISVTLAPLDQELSFQQGSLNAPLRENPAPRPTMKPQDEEDARHIGDETIDNLSPLNPKEKLQHIDATVPPSGEEEDTLKALVPPLKEQELLEPETSPQITENEAIIPPKEPDPAAPQVPMTPVQEPESVAPLVPETTKEAEPPAPAVPVKKIENRESPEKIELPEKTPLPHLKPKPAKQSASQDAKTPKKQGELTIEDILVREEKNLLNRTRTQGGGAKRSNKPEALGPQKNVGDTAKMAQTLVNIAGACIQKKLKLVAIGGNLDNRPIVHLQFYLDRRGMVVGEPVIKPFSGEENQQAIMMRQVYAAVFSCQPYADLPRDQYDLWGQGFDFNVDPLRGMAP